MGNVLPVADTKPLQTVASNNTYKYLWDSR
jgi:hypothetical protein